MKFNPFIFLLLLTMCDAHAALRGYNFNTATPVKCSEGDTISIEDEDELKAFTVLTKEQNSEKIILYLRSNSEKDKNLIITTKYKNNAFNSIRFQTKVSDEELSKARSAQLQDSSSKKP